MTRWIVMLAVALAPGTAFAQETANAWPGLSTSGLPMVYVLDSSGVETAGRLVRLNPDSLVLLVEDAEVRFEAARVRRLQQRGDSLRNGALIGAVVGSGLGLLAAGMTDCAGSLDPREQSCPGFRTAVFLGSIGLYLGIGTGIDALIVGRTTLFEAQAAAPARSAGLPGGGAFVLRVRW